MKGHKNLNVVNPKKPKRIAIVLSNPGWAELTHPYFYFSEVGYEVDLFSPLGGKVEGDASSDPEDPSQWQAEDVISRGYKHDPDFVALLKSTRPVDEISVDKYDAIVVAGGQGPMWTFSSAHGLHKKFAEFYEAGKVTAALCHGTAVLRYAMLSDGTPLVRGKSVTGFANVEEDFADAAMVNWGVLKAGEHVMPWRIEDGLKKLGANYIRSAMWAGFATRDGNLITGQQNYS
ncbi:hypothetical protein HDU93_004355 [Gonapodya sp. JEL0774]|nr:hypothetical protein HDU93_004355 [Gonapodya sp. JEL0774]